VGDRPECPKPSGQRGAPNARRRNRARGRGARRVRVTRALASAALALALLDGAVVLSLGPSLHVGDHTLNGC